MNLELVEMRIRRIAEIYSCNGRSVPDAFRMREILNLNLRRRRFAEYVNVYKTCNDGYS